VQGGFHRQTMRLPFALRELHTDNGAEFINRVLYPYCVKQGIKLSRGRPYKKNDQAYAEQKNWFVVRKTVGYDRFASHARWRLWARSTSLAALPELLSTAAQGVEP